MSPSTYPPMCYIFVNVSIHPSSIHTSVISPSTYPSIHPSIAQPFYYYVSIDISTHVLYLRQRINPSILHPHIYYISFDLSIHPSTHLLYLLRPIHPSTHLLYLRYIHRPTHPSIHPSINPSIHYLSFDHGYPPIYYISLDLSIHLLHLVRPINTHIYYLSFDLSINPSIRERERNVLFNDALNTFHLRLRTILIVRKGTRCRQIID